MTHAQGTTTGGDLEAEAYDDDDARYTSEMLQEALSNLHRSDKMSAYERRVILREVRDIIDQLLRDTDSVASSLEVEQAMRATSKDQDAAWTSNALKVLKEEMVRLMQHAERLHDAVGMQCKRLAAAWAAAGHSPSDLLEVRIQYSPKAIAATPEALSVLQELVEVWENSSDDAARSRSRDDAVQLLQETIRNVYGLSAEDAAAATTDRVHPRFAPGTPSSSSSSSSVGPTALEIVAMAARIRGSQAAFREIASLCAKTTVAQPPMLPGMRADSSSAPAEASRKEAFEYTENWLSDAQHMRKKIANWEEWSGFAFPVDEAVHRELWQWVLLGYDSNGCRRGTHLRPASDDDDDEDEGPKNSKKPCGPQVTSETLQKRSYLELLDAAIGIVRQD